MACDELINYHEKKNGTKKFFHWFLAIRFLRSLVLTKLEFGICVWYIYSSRKCNRTWKEFLNKWNNNKKKRKIPFLFLCNKIKCAIIFHRIFHTYKIAIQLSNLWLQQCGVQFQQNDTYTKHQGVRIYT